MAIKTLADVDVRWSSHELADEVKRSLGKGLKAAAIFLSSRVKELISVPAPRVRVLGKRGKAAGVIYYRATTPATPGAPPRKLSGRLRTSIAYEVDADGLEARVGTNVKYARRHEYGGHAFLVPTLDRWRGELAGIIRKAATI